MKRGMNNFARRIAIQIERRNASHPVCETCGAAFEATSTAQTHCPECSDWMNRGAVWGATQDAWLKRMEAENAKTCKVYSSADYPQEFLKALVPGS